MRLIKASNYKEDYTSEIYGITTKALADKVMEEIEGNDKALQDIMFNHGNGIFDNIVDNILNDIYDERHQEDEPDYKEIYDNRDNLRYGAWNVVIDKIMSMSMANVCKYFNFEIEKA